MLCVTSVLDFILLMQNHKKSVILAEALTLKYLKISCSWTFGNCRMSYQKLKFRRQKFNFIKGKILAYYKTCDNGRKSTAKVITTEFSWIFFLLSQSIHVVRKIERFPSRLKCALFTALFSFNFRSFFSRCLSDWKIQHS